MSSTSSSDGPGGATPSHRSWLLPAVALLVGCVLGAVLGAVLVGGGRPSGTGDGAPARAAPSEAPVPTPGTAEAAGEDGLYVRVPESCVSAADNALRMAQQADLIAAAVRDVDPLRLQESVDGMQQLRDEVERLAEQCAASTGERLPEPSATATPPAAPGA